MVKIETRLAKGVDGEGKPLTPARREELKAALPLYKKYSAEYKSVRVVLPTITFDSALTLHLGAREIQVRSFGRANTAGDVVIFLPKERIAAVGDMVVYPIPFIYGGFPVSWHKVLQSVRALDPVVIVPGHGPLMREFGYIDQVSALLASMASQVHDAVAKGLTLEETRKAVDLSAFHDAMMNHDRSREDTFKSSIIESGIAAAYKEAKELAAKP